MDIRQIIAVGLIIILSVIVTICLYRSLHKDSFGDYLKKSEPKKKSGPIMTWWNRR